MAGTVIHMNEIKTYFLLNFLCNHHVFVYTLSHSGFLMVPCRCWHSYLIAFVISPPSGKTSISKIFFSVMSTILVTYLYCLRKITDLGIRQILIGILAAKFNSWPGAGPLKNLLLLSTYWVGHCVRYWRWKGVQKKSLSWN